MKPTISYEELLRTKLVEAAATMMATKHTTQPLSSSEVSVYLGIESDKDNSTKIQIRLAQAKLKAHEDLSASPLLQVQALRYQRLQDLAKKLTGLSEEQLKELGHVGLSSLWADAMFAIRRDSLEIVFLAHKKPGEPDHQALQFFEDEHAAQVLAVETLERDLFNLAGSKANKGSQADYTQHIKWQYYCQHKVHQVEIEASLGSIHPIDKEGIEQVSGNAARTLDQTQQALAMVMSAFAKDVKSKYKKEINLHLKSTLPGGDSGTLKKAKESRRWLKVMMLAAKAYRRSLRPMGEPVEPGALEEQKMGEVVSTRVAATVAAQEAVNNNYDMLKAELPALFPAALYDEGERKEKEERCLMLVFDAFNQHDQGRGDYFEMLTRLADVIQSEIYEDYHARRGKEPKNAKRVLKGFRDTLQRLHQSKDEHSESRYVLNTIQQAGSGAELRLNQTASGWLASEPAFEALQNCLATKMAALSTANVQEFAQFKTCLDSLTGVMVELYQKRDEGLDPVFFDHVHQQVDAQLESLKLSRELLPTSVQETAVFAGKLQSLIHLARYMTIRLESVRVPVVRELLRQAYLEKFTQVRDVEDTADLPLAALSRDERDEIRRVESVLKEILQKQDQLKSERQQKENKYTQGKTKYAGWCEDATQTAAEHFLDDGMSIPQGLNKHALGAQSKIMTINRLQGLLQAEREGYLHDYLVTQFGSNDVDEDEEEAVELDSSEDSESEEKSGEVASKEGDEKERSESPGLVAPARSAVFSSATGNALNALTACLNKIGVKSRRIHTLIRLMTELHTKLEAFEDREVKAQGARSTRDLKGHQKRRSSIVYSKLPSQEEMGEHLDDRKKPADLQLDGGEGGDESLTSSLLSAQKVDDGEGGCEHLSLLEPTMTTSSGAGVGKGGGKKKGEKPEDSTQSSLSGKMGGGGEGEGDQLPLLDSMTTSSGAGLGEQRQSKVPTPPPLPGQMGGGGEGEGDHPSRLASTPLPLPGKKGGKPEGGAGQRRLDFLKTIAALREGKGEDQSSAMKAGLRPVGNRKLAEKTKSKKDSAIDKFLERTKALQSSDTEGDSDSDDFSDEEDCKTKQRPVMTARRIVTKPTPNSGGTVGVEAEEEAMKQGGKADAKRANSEQRTKKVPKNKRLLLIAKRIVR